MIEKNKGLHIAILIIGIIAYLVIYLFIGPLHTSSTQNYLGTLSQLQVVIVTVILMTNKKRGFIAALSLCALSSIGTLSGVLHGSSSAMIGLMTSIVTIAILIIIYNFLVQNDRQHQELSEQYEQMIDSNRLMQEKDEALKELAYKDEMTDMYNLAYFREQMQEHLNQNEVFTIIYMDLDNFKSVNDSFGPEVGDTVLKVYAERILRTYKTSFLCARTGGDDFAVLLTGTMSEADILSITEQFRQIFISPVTAQGNTIFLTASYGIALYPRDGKTTEDLLDNAIMAVYSAKSNGKNQPRFFSHA